VLDDVERGNRLRAALEALPERCRLVMQLRWEEQLSHAEIAEVMGITVKGVERQLARGLRALRDKARNDLR
jgi:RNA polymerase sigma-70 factor (ECF subfamily)